MAKNKKFIFLGIVFVVVLVLFGACRDRKIQPKTQVVSKNFSEYTVTGFGQPEQNFTWTNAKEATIEIPWPELQDNYGLSMAVKMFPFLDNGVLKKQFVDVLVNDKLIAKWTVDKADVYTAVLPGDIKNQGDIINIKFVINNSQSHKKRDARNFGIAVQNLSLIPFDLNNPDNFATYDIGDEILFTQGNGAEKYMVSGWSAPEQDFTWTNGKDAVVKLFVNDTKDKKLQLNIYGHAVFASKADNQKIMVYVNDQELTTWEVGKEYGTYSVKLPESVVQNGALQIRLHIDKPVKVGQDPRDLGMAVNMIKVSQVFAAKTKSKMANWVKNNVLTDSEKTTKKSK